MAYAATSDAMHGTEMAHAGTSERRCWWCSSTLQVPARRTNMQIFAFHMELSCERTSPCQDITHTENFAFSSVELAWKSSPFQCRTRMENFSLTRMHLHPKHACKPAQHTLSLAKTTRRRRLTRALEDAAETKQMELAENRRAGGAGGGTPLSREREAEGDAMMLQRPSAKMSLLGDKKASSGRMNRFRIAKEGPSQLPQSPLLVAHNTLDCARSCASRHFHACREIVDVDKAGACVRACVRARGAGALKSAAKVILNRCPPPTR
eukprot:2428932-Rhodomonas_salina.3